MILNRRHGVAAVASAAMLLTLAACSTESSEGFAQDSDTLILGMVPDQQSVENNFQPLVDYISTVTGKEVVIIESTDYAALVEAAIAGRIDIGTFSGFTYVAAQNGGANLVPIGVQVTEPGAEPGYESLAVVPADSEIGSLEDLAGRTVCFVDPGSTSGFLYPSSELLAVGIDPETGLTPVFSGGHDAVVQMVAQGVECEAGFAENMVVEITGPAQGLFAEGDLRVINRTTIPGAPVVISGNLPQEVQDELTESLQSITLDDIAAEGIEITEAFAAYFYELVPVDDSYYEGVRQVCELTGAPQCTP